MLDLDFESLASWIIKERYQYMFIEFIEKEIKFGNYDHNTSVRKKILGDGKNSLNKNIYVPWYIRYGNKINIKIEIPILGGLF